MPTTGMPKRLPASTDEVAAKSRQIGGARGAERGVDAVRAAPAELQQRRARRGACCPRRLARDQRRRADLVDHQRFEQLRLRQRRDYLQQRLVREDRAPLRRRPDLAREAEAAQALDERIVELRQPGQPGEIVLVETQRLNPLQRLLQPGRQQETPAVGQAARAELENRRRDDAPLVVELRHHQLVEVGEQPRCGSHADAPRSMAAPAAANSASAASPSPAAKSTAATALVTTVVSKPSASASSAVAFTQ